MSTALLDRWLGPRLPAPFPKGQERFYAIASAAKKDPDHPRKAVKRALIHRGAAVYTNEGVGIRFPGGAAPARAGWTPVAACEYPADQEEG